MITAVADVDQIDRRQSRFSLPRMAASYYWPCLAILGTPWPAHTHLRYPVTAPCSASGTPVIPGQPAAHERSASGVAWVNSGSGQAAADTLPGHRQLWGGS